MINSLFSLVFDLFQIPVAENNPFLVGMHYWYSSYSLHNQHCNICRETIPALSGDGIVCEGSFLTSLQGSSVDEDRTEGAHVALVSLTFQVTDSD